jgi:hypothetical protein
MCVYIILMSPSLDDRQYLVLVKAVLGWKGLKDKEAAQNERTKYTDTIRELKLAHRLSISLARVASLALASPQLQKSCPASDISFHG